MKQSIQGSFLKWSNIPHNWCTGARTCFRRAYSNAKCTIQLPQQWTRCASCYQHYVESQVAFGGSVGVNWKQAGNIIPLLDSISLASFVPCINDVINYNGLRDERCQQPMLTQGWMWGVRNAGEQERKWNKNWDCQRPELELRRTLNLSSALD